MLYVVGSSVYAQTVTLGLVGLCILVGEGGSTDFTQDIICGLILSCQQNANNGSLDQWQRLELIAFAFVNFLLLHC